MIFPFFMINPRLVTPFFVFVAFPSQTDLMVPNCFFLALRAFFRLVTRLFLVTRLLRETLRLREARRVERRRLEALREVRRLTAMVVYGGFYEAKKKKRE